MTESESEYWYRAEVFRKAHELSDRHGWNAQEYAARLATEALAEGKVSESEFWNAVKDALTVRDSN